MPNLRDRYLRFGTTLFGYVWNRGILGSEQYIEVRTDVPTYRRTVLVLVGEGDDIVSCFGPTMSFGGG